MSHDDPKQEELELCGECRSGALELREQGWYCPGCRIYTQQLEIEHERLVVPANYQSNATVVKLCSRERIATRCFQGFANRYNIHGPTQMDVLLGEVVRYLGGAGRCHSYADVCAAIFFYNYREELRLSARPFCKDNHVDIRKFNQALLKYVKVKNNDGSYRENSKLEKPPEEVLAQTQSLLKMLSTSLFSFSLTSRERQEEFAEVVIRKIRQDFTSAFNQYCWRAPAPLIFRALKLLHHPVTVSRFLTICKGHNVPVSRKQLLRQHNPTNQEPLKSQTSCEPTGGHDSGCFD